MRRKWWIIGAVAVVVIAGIAIYSTFDPSTVRFFPRCTFLSLTGLKCPGCGTQRAIHALLHGNFLEAVRFNAMMVASVPLLALYGYAEIVRKSKPRFYNKVNSTPIILTIFVLVVLWWILRNVFGW